jgi:hypothetical protein
MNVGQRGVIMRRLSFHAVVIGAFALLTVLLTYPLILYFTSHIPSHMDLAPAIVEHWIYTWGFWFVKHLVVGARHWSFFTDALYYPRGVDLTYPVLFGLGLPLAAAIPVVPFLGVILTFNLFVFITFVVTAYATFLLVRDLTNDNGAALISGIIFAFSPFQMARLLGHFGIVTSTIWLPLYVFFFMRAMTYGYIHYLILAPLVISLTFFSHPYYAIFLMFFTVFYIIYHLIFNRDCPIKNLLRTRLLPMSCLTVLFSLPLIWILLTHSTTGFHMYSPKLAAYQHSADLLAFFLPSTHHSISGNLVKPIFYSHFIGSDTEQTVYMGYTVLVLSVIAVVKAPKAQTRFWLVSAIAFFVLSLGPFLRIYGENSFEIAGLSVAFPLPYFPILFIPGLKAMRGPSRFAIMSMLALAVLAGYGVRHLLKRFEGQVGATLVLLGLLLTLIGLEFSIVPVPLVDARIPKVYERIAREQGGTILDVPWYWSVSKYQHYQTLHHKRLVFGQAPRLTLPFDFTYADAIPFVQLFKNPQLIKDYEAQPVDRGDVLRFIEFFDLSFIAIHKDLLDPGFFVYFVRVPWDNSLPVSPLLQASEVFDRLMRFLIAHFPVERVEEEGNIVVLKLARKHQVDDLWQSRDRYVLDFGSIVPQFFLTEGFRSPERSGDLTFAWADAKESRLWVYLSSVQPLSMELKLLPFTIPGGPPQGLKIYVNGRFVDYIALTDSEWRSYTVHLPQTDLLKGINTLHFVYNYTASPSKVFPGNQDLRQLAVSFDFITFHLE